MSKKYKTQTYKIGEKMYLYRRSDSKYFYCYLYINQKSYRKSLMSTDYDESERLCYEYKNKLLSDSNSEASKENMSFSYFSKKLIEKEKTYQKQQSGLYLYSLTENILNRKKGLLSYFGSTDVRSIKSSDFDKFIQQMNLNKKVLSKSPYKWVGMQPSRADAERMSKEIEVHEDEIKALQPLEYFYKSPGIGNVKSGKLRW